MIARARHFGSALAQGDVLGAHNVGVAGTRRTERDRSQGERRARAARESGSPKWELPSQHCRVWANVKGPDLV